MSAAYEGAPWSSEIGWAFSYSGHETQNVVEKFGFVSPVNGLYYEKSFRYKVAIATDDNGDPVSATLTEEESEWNWHEYLLNNIRVPLFLDCGLALFRITKYRTDRRVPPVEESYSFPIYVYYEGDTARVFRYNRGHPVTTVIPPNPFPFKSGQNFSEDPADNGKVFSNYPVTKTERNMSISGLHAGVGNGCNTSTVYLGEQMDVQREIESIDKPVTSSNDVNSSVVGSAHIIRRNQYLDASFGNRCPWSFIIPFFEREGYMFGSGTVTSVSSTKNTFWQTWVGGTYTYSGPWSWRTYWGDTPYGGSNMTEVMHTSCSDDCSQYSDCGGAGANPIQPVYTPFYIFGMQMDTQHWHALSGGPSERVHATECISSLDGTKGTLKYYVTYYNNGTIFKISDDILTSADGSTEEEYDESYQLQFIYKSSDDSSAVTSLEFTDTIFSGTLNDPNECSFGSPWWMGAWMDAFNTGNGFVSKNADSEDGPVQDSTQVIGQAGNYDLDGRIVGNRTSGWIGLPFPGEFTE